jgi:hypothetical protein
MIRLRQARSSAQAARRSAHSSGVSKGGVTAAPSASSADSSPAQSRASTRAVARHDHRHRVGAARGANCTGGLWRADVGGQLAVGAGLAGRDTLQGLPDLVLERRAKDVEGQRTAGRVLRIVHRPHRFGDPVGVIAIQRPDRRLREAGDQVANHHLAIVTHEDCADAALRRRHEDLSQRALAETVADHLALAALAVGAWRHAQHLRRVLVEPAGRIVAGGVEGLGDAGGDAKLRLNPGVPLGGRVGLGRDADDPLEQAMEVMRAETRLVRKLRQRRFRFGSLDGAASPRDHLGLPFRFGRQVRAAAFAGPEAPVQRLFHRIDKEQVLPPRRAGGAPRPADDAS